MSWLQAALREKQVKLGAAEVQADTASQDLAIAVPADLVLPEHDLGAAERADHNAVAEGPPYSHAAAATRELHHKVRLQPNTSHLLSRKFC